MTFKWWRIQTHIWSETSEQLGNVHSVVLPVGENTYILAYITYTCRCIFRAGLVVIPISQKYVCSTIDVNITIRPTQRVNKRFYSGTGKLWIFNNMNFSSIIPYVVCRFCTSMQINYAQHFPRQYNVICTELYIYIYI